MSDFTAQKGDLLSDLEVELVDRTGTAMDLSAATQVLIYMRPVGSTTNELDGVACSIELPKTEGRITGPAEPLDTAARYQAYFKVVFGSVAKRVPSNDFVQIRVRENFEA